MTPLIFPTIHEKLTKDAFDGRPSPVFQVLISVLPSGTIMTEYGGIANRPQVNMALVTAHQDMLEILRKVEAAHNGTGPGIAIVTDQEAIAKLNAGRK